MKINPPGSAVHSLPVKSQSIIVPKMKGIASAAILGMIIGWCPANAFTSPHNTIHRISPSSTLLHAANEEPFEVMVTLPGGKDLSAQMKFKSVLDVPSELVEVRYKLPFGLDVAPKNNLAVCTKDGVSV